MNLVTGVTGLCGGSVISNNAVLTAAHCSDIRTATFNIIAGAHNMQIPEPNQQRRNVLVGGWVQHPDFGPLTLSNDVAVITFLNGLNFNNFVQPIALADSTETFVGEEVFVSGFGRVSDSLPETSPVLRFTIKTVITNVACRIRFPVAVSDSTICAIGDDIINNAICDGDSGMEVKYK